MTSDDGGTGRGGGAGPLRARRVAETTSVKSTIEAHYHLGPSALIREAPAAPPGTRPGSRVSTRRGGSANPAKRTPTHTHTQKKKTQPPVHPSSVGGGCAGGVETRLARFFSESARWATPRRRHRRLSPSAKNKREPGKCRAPVSFGVAD